MDNHCLSYEKVKHDSHEISLDLKWMEKKKLTNTFSIFLLKYLKINIQITTSLYWFLQLISRLSVYKITFKWNIVDYNNSWKQKQEFHVGIYNQ